MRNLGLRQRLQCQWHQQADYATLRFRNEDRLSRRAAWAVGLFWAGAIGTFIGLGLWSVFHD